MIVSLDQLIDKYNTATRSQFFKGQVRGHVQRQNYTSTYALSGSPYSLPSAIPTTGETTNSLSPGAIKLPTVTTEKIYLSNISLNSGENFDILLVDRLSHVSGIVGNVTTKQNITMPNLTRYTNGFGVAGYLEVLTATGGTSVSATVEYVNQDDVTKTVSVTFTYPSATLGYCVKIPLAVNDLGMKKILSVQLSASTGGAGNICAFLAKEVYCSNNNPSIDASTSVNAFDSGLIEINKDACLSVLVFPNHSSSPYQLSGGLTFVRA